MKYILYGTGGAYSLTTVENYNAYIQDARKITRFNDFSTVDAVINYISEYFPIALNDIIINTN